MTNDREIEEIEKREGEKALLIGFLILMLFPDGRDAALQIKLKII